MQKIIRQGKVAVLISPGYGAGWWTWNENHIQLLFHPKLVEMVEQGRQHEINEEWCEEHLGLLDVYTGGAIDLTIVWVNEGEAFWVNEYDGYESLKLAVDNWIIA